MYQMEDFVIANSYKQDKCWQWPQDAYHNKSNIIIVELCSEHFHLHLLAPALTRCEEMRWEIECDVEMHTR